MAETESIKGATIQELKAALPESDPAFLLTQLESGATVPAAQGSWIKELQARLTTKNTELVTAKTKITELEAAAPKKPGVTALGEASAPKKESLVDPKVAWNDAVEAKVKIGMPKSKAIAAVVRENKELHEAFVAAMNTR